MSSPYPLWYSSRWLYYYFRPSTKNHTGLERAPARAVLLDRSADEEVVRLAFFGDLMCMQADRVPDVDAEVAALLGRADLVIGNCEAPILFKDKRPDAMYLVHYAMAQQYLAEFLERLRVTPNKCVLSVANNHAGDRGQEGFEETLRHLADLGITAAGAEGSPVTVVRSHGLEIGIAAWTHWMNSETHRKRGLVQRADDVASHAWPETKRERNLDCLIGFPHWDYEFQHFPKKSTQALAHQLCARGFDAIVGHHPHVVQPLERIGDALCFYSLGNLNGPPLRRPGWSTKLMAILELSVIANGPRKGKIAEYAMHRFAQRGPPREHVELVAIGGMPDPVRSRLEERFALLFEETR